MLTPEGAELTPDIARLTPDGAEAAGAHACAVHARKHKIVLRIDGWKTRKVFEEYGKLKKKLS